MDILFTIVVILLVFVAAFWFSSKIAMEAPIRNIVNAVLALIGIFLVLGVLFGKVPIIPFGW